MIVDDVQFLHNPTTSQSILADRSCVNGSANRLPRFDQYDAVSRLVSIPTTRPTNSSRHVLGFCLTDADSMTPSPNSSSRLSAGARTTGHPVAQACRRLSGNTSVGELGSHG